MELRMGPVQLLVDLISGVDGSVWFGNTEYSNLCVFKYEDVDGNGKYDAGDKPYVGWGIEVKNAAGATVKTGVTGADGWICWDDMKPGTYYVSEESVTGWYATENVTQVTVIITSGDDEEVWFRHTEYSDLCVFKYEDVNGNGKYDAGDKPYVGWGIEVRTLPEPPSRPVSPVLTVGSAGTT